MHQSPIPFLPAMLCNFKIVFNRQIMKELAGKSKRPSQPFPRTALLPPSKPNPCQPKPQPNIVHFSQYAHPRRDDPARRDELKENRLRENEQQASTRGKPNVLLKDQRRSHQSTQEDPMRRTQKKLRPQKGRTEWVAVEEEEGLGCHENLNAQLFRPGLGLSRSGVSTRHLGETGTRRMGEAEMMAEFERSLPEVAWREESERLAELVRREEQDSRGAHSADYLPRQPHLTWLNRAFVLNWIMLLASELHCRREVLANAVSLFDRYLAASPPVLLERLQLLGAGCLFLAEKLEDNTRVSASSFWDPISERHSQEELLDQETEIAVRLGFKLRSPTVNSWANRLCAQWDLYVSGKENDEVTAIRFKSGSPESYQNFRMLAEFIDCSLLDIQTRQYKNRTLAAAFLFLTVLLRLEVHTPEEVAARFRSNSQLVLAPTPFNLFFSTFLQDSFGFPLADILPAVQYASVFVVLPLGQQMPQVDREGELMSFEEYCGLQTFNSHQKATLAKLNRQPW